MNEEYRTLLQPCLQGMTNVVQAVGNLLYLKELLKLLFIGLQALLMGKNDLFLVFLQARKGNLRQLATAKAVFCLFLPIILAPKPMNICASSSCIHSGRELIGI